LIAAGFVAVGAIAIVLAVVFTQGGGDDGGEVAQPTNQPLPSASGVPLEPTDPDSEAIIALSRKSIEVLPQGQWPSLYEDFTEGFQSRCPKESFDQAGVDTGVNLGADLALLAFKFVQDASFTEDSGVATIVAEVTGKYEYQVNAGFKKEDGVWKLAPVANTSGCSAFTVLS
jgi:hypothetical protein